MDPESPIYKKYYKNYLEVSKNTHGIKFEKLQRVLKFFQDIPWLERPGEASTAIAELRLVIHGQPTLEVVAESFKVFEDFKIIDQEKVENSIGILKTLRKNDPRYCRYREIRNRYNHWRMELIEARDKLAKMEALVKDVT